MEKYLFTSWAFALALAMSGLPAIAFAENNGGESQDGATAQVTSVQAKTQVGERGGDASTSTSVRSDNGEQSPVNQQQLQERVGQVEATSSGRIGSEEGNSQEIDLELEDDSNPATSLGDLQQKIEVRKQQLQQEVSSTTSSDQSIVENANPVRLAVHALLASKDLIGGIGPKVSEIAKQVNDSIATTTNAEVRIQSRGFLTRLFFGGDSAAADVISQEVAQNQQRITDLTALLDQANISADIQATLKAQITALEDAQTRLQDLAQREQKMWGLFSWRF